VSLPAPDPAFEALLEHVRLDRGFDYTGYKRQSLMRRFEKRMQAVGTADFDEYRTYLDQHPDEYIELFNTILINVTGFFRDPAAWEYVAGEVIPSLLQSKNADDWIRVWSAGCASGQEPYTVAILFLEALGEDAFRGRVKIYATDIDDEALNQGRHAAYTPDQLSSLEPSLVERYFTRMNTHYVFRSDLRRTVIFGRNDLLRDPPISRIDLLVCRNTLMYFNPDVQSKILQNFHFALNNSGFLVLGKSEVMLTRTQLLVPLDLRQRVFVKSDRRPAVEQPPLQPPPEPRDSARDDEDVIRDAALEHAPGAQILVDRRGAIAAANHLARQLFALTPQDIGRPLKDLPISYRPLELRSRIEQVYAETRPVSVRDVEHATSDGKTRYLDVQLSPLLDQTGQILGVSLSFADVTRAHELQSQLEQSKGELETAYEELQSTNEELETTNEELQSTNEELETMNEELQSTNEELETINDELRDRTDESMQANVFLETVLTSLQTGVVVVDRDLRVRAWNHQSEELWGLRADEVVNRHFLNLDIGLPVAELSRPIRACLADPAANEEVELDARDRRGRLISCRIRCSPLVAPRGVQGAILLVETTLVDSQRQ
jgi:two-component system CheB/CheR fusion protein